MTDTRSSLQHLIGEPPVVLINQVHLRDAVRLLRAINADPVCPVEIYSDDRGLSLVWGNAVARVPASAWLIGRFEVAPEAFFKILSFPARVRSRAIRVRYCGHDRIVFDRLRVPGVRFAD